MFHILIIHSKLNTSKRVLFEGNSRSVLLPGQDGEFEILDFHKPIISRLKKGYIVVDNDKDILIQGGIAKMSSQKLVAVVDL